MTLDVELHSPEDAATLDVVKGSARHIGAVSAMRALRENARNSSPEFRASQTETDPVTEQSGKANTPDTIRGERETQTMRQAGMTADTYMVDAKGCIDREFGAGYAGKHPELLAAFMRTCAQDFYTTLVKAGLQDICFELYNIASALERDDDPTD